MRIKVALALTSAVFMMTWVTTFVSVISRSMSVTTAEVITSDLFFIATIELLSLTSLFGSLLFLLEARKTLSRWYLAIPLCISLSLFVIINFLVYSNEKPFLGAPISTVETLWLIILALLSPSSLFFFLSSNGHDGSMYVYVVVSFAVSIFSMFFLFLTLMEISKETSIDGVLLPLIFYWDICLPAIGVCFLSKATMHGNNNETQEP
ncbi:hypothetical protein MSSAC_2369 [Methanosarcina siciliae C2J]|uniref:Uncharacterized protein n=3 Tax=Methanosarcina siciliae TaxID=38027 RepID=A0A0E3PDP9_9EURY|nr:hypothetical protein [Methanosarcina siciliae]AKB28735.1 hypothetical protein MSSIT_2016 [Methanosarcina siciliae T4/M]AKB32662.1 hypothetical protein MSSIH_1972 [Methanosarcina siciliae HI350]AKB36959.1 hypothetical protein MSSAC_2369 [Methanosarcina siciliae C2J]